MVRHHRTQLATAATLLIVCLGSALGDSQTIAASSGTNSSTAQCVAQNLQGQCNSCVCCCYKGSSAFFNYLPTAQCTCGRSFNSEEIKVAVVLAVIVLVPTLLTSFYLGGQICISPYKKHRNDGETSPSRPSSPAPPGSLERRRTGSTIQLSVRTG